MSCYVKSHENSNKTVILFVAVRPFCLLVGKVFQHYIDGGYSSNLPNFPDVPTLTVSPFSGDAIISPLDRSRIPAVFEWKMRVGNQYVKVNMQNVIRGAQALFPPSNDVLEGYYQMGFRDAYKFLIESELIERETGTSV
ncbi:hypothetical protein AB6A40_005285 [Gnathostoma spinigerum]|uniref:Uncharacterized protein n=1 Tax=Gnathostoma spinigerum TaxID=75299 RepID=A0ABD6EFV9_9BILA